jgi:hypothetical protein
MDALDTLQIAAEVVVLRDEIAAAMRARFEEQHAFASFDTARRTGTARSAPRPITQLDGSHTPTRRRHD